MNALRLAPVILAGCLMAAHFVRAGQTGLAVASLAALLLLFIRRAWAAHAVTVLLLAAAVVWLDAAFTLVDERTTAGEPWLRGALILGATTAFTAASALVFRLKALRERYGVNAPTARASAFAFFLVLVTLGVLQAKLHKPVPLLAERFLPGAGWVEALALAAYAAWLSEKMLLARFTAFLRSKIWLAFSIVFFAQLILGLVGFDKFLMTGALHLPVPALIAAGPIFRGGGFFMLILFLSTVVLVGPAWCSHLCYIGAWDNYAARARKRPEKLPWWREHLRVVILAATILTALGLRLLGVSTAIAAAIAATFGAGGVAVMALWSRRVGAMAHCTAYCPIGLAADVLGRLNPFRIRIGEGCDQCGACMRVCRYNALDVEHIQARKPGITCTLCGDCVGSCHVRQIRYTLPGAKGEAARVVFIVLVVSLHALFLGLARI